MPRGCLTLKASHREAEKENFDAIVIALHQNTHLFNSDSDRDVRECELKEPDFVGIADVDAEVDCKTSLEVIFRTQEVHFRLFFVFPLLIRAFRV